MKMLQTIQLLLLLAFIITCNGSGSRSRTMGKALKAIPLPSIVTNFTQSYPLSPLKSVYLLNHHVSLSPQEMGYSKHVSSNSQTTKSFKCMSLSEVYNPTVTCSGVVDYDFILYDSETLSGLEAAVRELANSFNSFINPYCLSDAKRLICALIYRPCVPNVESVLESTYQLSADGSLLPYERPCGSLCVATTYLGTTCQGILEGLGIGFDCTATSGNYSTYDYNSLPSSANESYSIKQPKCNSLPNTAGELLVSFPSEPYIGKQCRGIVETYYVPPSYTLNTTLAPLLPPNVTQTIVEEVMLGIDLSIPRFLKSECLLAQRELLCTTLFTAAYPSEALAAYFGTVFIPSYPAYSTCTNYASKCAAVIASSPSSAIDCNTSYGSVHLYPNKTQTILRINLGYGIIIDLDSPPYYIPDNVTTSSVVGVTSQCPLGTALPTDSSKSTIQWISGTACALACPSPIYTAHEYSYIYQQLMIGSMIGLVMGVMQMINISILRSSKQNIFVICSVIFAFIILGQRTFQILIVQDSKSLICDTNASWYSKTDYQENSLSYSCFVTAVIDFTTSTFAYWVLVALSVEVWLRVVKMLKNVNPYRKYYMGGTFLVVLAQILLVLFYDNSDDQIPGSDFMLCAWGPKDTDLRYYLMTIPHTIYCAVAFSFAGHSAYTCIMISTRVKSTDKKSPLLKIWKSYSMLILFLAMDLVIYPPIVINFESYEGYALVDHYTQGVVDWLTCILTYYKNDSDDSYITTCGDHPSVRVSVNLYLSTLAATYMVAILLFFMTMNAEVKAFWWNAWVRLTDALGLRVCMGLLGAQKFSFKKVKTNLRSIATTVASENESDERDYNTNTMKNGKVAKVNFISRAGAFVKKVVNPGRNTVAVMVKGGMDGKGQGVVVVHQDLENVIVNTPRDDEDDGDEELEDTDSRVQSTVLVGVDQTKDIIVDTANQVAHIAVEDGISSWMSATFLNNSTKQNKYRLTTVTTDDKVADCERK